MAEADQNQTALCVLSELVAIQFWLPLFCGASQLLPSVPGIGLWWDGGQKCESSGKEARNLSNSLTTLIVLSKKLLTLKTSDRVISGFKFPSVTPTWASAILKQLQLWRYHWRLVSSLRQIFCAQRAAGMTPVWRSGSSVTKLWRCQIPDFQGLFFLI